MAQSPQPRAGPRSKTAASRLREFLDGHPDAGWRYTLAELAREIGVSRQLVFMLLPGWTEARQRLATRRVRAFARRHPKVRGADTRERRNWAKIATEIGLPVSTVKAIWHTWGPTNDDRLDPEAVKRGRAERQQRRLAEVVRRETCVRCGVEFAWTRGHERARKYGGRSTACSRSCGQRLRFDRADGKR